jgi:hypothetical protein
VLAAMIIEHANMIAKYKNIKCPAFIGALFLDIAEAFDWQCYGQN